MASHRGYGADTMKPGFPPKPTALKILAGNPSRRPLPQNEPQPQRGRPNCPQWIGTEAKATWKKLAPLLDNMGVLTLIYGNALTRYCVMFAEWRKLWMFIEPHGTVYPLKDSRKNVNGVTTWPQVRTALALGEQLGKLEREVGLAVFGESAITKEGPSWRTQSVLNVEMSVC